MTGLGERLGIVAAFALARWRWNTLGPERLAAFQERRASAIVGYAARHAPFYRDHWRGADLADWRRLPTVDKATMMANFSQFNTRGIEREAALAVALAAETSRDFSPTLGDLTVGLSSGTSGHRGLFLVGPAEQRAWAGTILSRALHRLRPIRIAFFLRSNSNLYERIGGRLIQFRYFDLMSPLPAAIAALNAFQPTVVVGPPSLLQALARACGALRIAPQRLIAVAEVLEPQDRDELATAFGAPVEQIYQCTEGLLAVSCASGRLHIQEDIVAMQCEPLGDGRVTPIITDLWRTTQPIIRYRLNDLLALDPRPCPCGSAFRVIERIEGRCDDVCYFSAGGERRAVYPDVIRRALLLSDAAISDYQAIQAADDQLSVHLDLDPAARETPAEAIETVRRSLRDTLAGYGCERAAIEVSQGLIALPPGAKRRRVWRER